MCKSAEIFVAAVAGLLCTSSAFAEEPSPSGRTFVFEELVTLAPNMLVGPTSLGTRNIVPITGGHFNGPDISGTILPGGWDWQLRRPDGCTQIEANYMLRTDDGAVINIINKGLSCAGPDGKRVPIKTYPVFEPPLGKYEWLGKSIFVGKLESTSQNGQPAVRIRIYKVG